MPNDGKERKEQKINLRQRRTRQTARERGPDAAWEGYLIYDITPLFPFSLPLLLHASLPLTSLRVSARAQTIFALSPPHPGTTSPPPVPPVLPFNPEGLYFLYDPTINEAISRPPPQKKVQKWKVVHLRLWARLQINAEELAKGGNWILSPLCGSNNMDS